jgi:hypothetical protein
VKPEAEGNSLEGRRIDLLGRRTMSPGRKRDCWGSDLDEEEGEGGVRGPVL